MQDNQEVRIRELPSAKRPRYANVPSFAAYPSMPDRGAGSSLMPVQGNRVNSWPRGMGFPHAASPISFPRPALQGICGVRGVTAITLAIAPSANNALLAANWVT